MNASLPPAENAPENARAAAKALLAFWRQSGVDMDAAEAVYAAPPAPSAATPQASSPAGKAAKTPAKASARPMDADAPILAAREAAAAADSVEALKRAVEQFELCPLKATARNTVFADGAAGARVLLIGDAPGKDEDETGKPFAGRSGQLLDKMLAAIGLDRRENILISNLVYWRPPGDRDLNPGEIAVCLPFVERLISSDEAGIGAADGPNHGANAAAENRNRNSAAWQNINNAAFRHSRPCQRHGHASSGISVAPAAGKAVGLGGFAARRLQARCAWGRAGRSAMKWAETWRRMTQMLKQGFLVAALATAGLSASAWADPAPQPAAPSPTESAATAPEVSGVTVTVSPRVHVRALSDSDEAAYRAAFNAIDEHNWAGVRSALNRVDDDSLVSVVKGRMLLSRAYRPSYAELTRWLNEYRRTPLAGEVYDRAVDARPRPRRRHRNRTAPPPEPIGGATRLPTGSAPPVDGDSPQARVAIARIDEAMWTGDFAGARQLALSASLGPRSGEANWRLGLMAYRDHDYAEATRRFEAAVSWGHFGGWALAGARYWAARSRIAAGEPEGAVLHLEQAAARPWTFYGQLAEAQLGRDTTLNFRPPQLEQDDAVRFIERHAGARRAAALAQLDQLQDSKTNCAACTANSRPVKTARILRCRLHCRRRPRNCAPPNLARRISPQASARSRHLNRKAATRSTARLFMPLCGKRARSIRAPEALRTRAG